MVDVVFEARVDNVQAADAEAEGGGEVRADGGEGVVGQPGGVCEGEVGAVGGLHEGEEDGTGTDGVFEGEFVVGASADEERVSVVEIRKERLGSRGGVEEAADEERFGGAGAVRGAGAVGGGEEDGGTADLFGELFARGVAEVEVRGFKAVGFACEEQGAGRVAADLAARAASSESKRITSRAPACSAVMIVEVARSTSRMMTCESGSRGSAAARSAGVRRTSIMKNLFYNHGGTEDEESMHVVDYMRQTKLNHDDTKRARAGAKPARSSRFSVPLRNNNGRHNRKTR